MGALWLFGKTRTKHKTDFFQYYVGTSDTLLVQTTCLSAHMYPQISKCTDKTRKKHYGGGGGLTPLPLAMLVLQRQISVNYCHYTQKQILNIDMIDNDDL